MKIVVDENMPHALELFAEFGEVIPLPGRQMQAADLQDADVLLVRSVTRVDAELLDTSPRLRFVGTATIGTDHVDKALLAARNIPFFSAPGCNKYSVGDYVLSALLVLAERHELNLSEMSLAVIGAGNTGECVAGKAEALGMRVLRCDPPRARAAGQAGETGAFVDYQAALGADIVSFHVPITREGPDATFHLLDGEAIAARPAGQILVNASRGEVWDNQALLARQQGLEPLRLVMDVWEGEPEPLRALVPHTEIATPHIAGYSLEGKARGTWMLYQALCQQLGRAARQDLQSLLPAPEVRALTPGQPADQALIKQLVHLIYDVRRDDARFRNRIGQPGSFDEQRKHYPERRELSSLHVSGPFASDTLARLGFTVQPG
ncbi:4-phosphoerythronate dehydrogenase [Aeromonas salmonicida]|uniref:4-phosphoerythronate dehydrogenase n=1 Tax=Aeromonas salmonicida TaxID=645 RepID=UPI00073C45EC|nr:4-phosphoerythronate dehydrogenase [Aeromonas salmonicida]KTA82820.1 erythronate-4-phosphate dehydrogenase [Aeromonas salmonicida]MDE7526844.1 4-phosphoerythronate dehydrogenase [Aeromonas salmonicida]MDE7531271.1 4-phosphoerythronate dehydrogenase [Aeromonas salmonicida]